MKQLMPPEKGILIILLALSVFLGGFFAPEVKAQIGPFSAQIQRALTALGISSDGSGGTSITDLTITGTCTGCPGGSFDSTAVDATTWSDGANASNLWTFDVSGTDTTLLFGNDLIDIGATTLRLKNGGTATTFEIYGDFTDESNGAYLSLRHNGTDAILEAVDEGTGPNDQNLSLQSEGSGWTQVNHDSSSGTGGLRVNEGTWDGDVESAVSGQAPVMFAHDGSQVAGLVGVSFDNNASSTGFQMFKTRSSEGNTSANTIVVNGDRAGRLVALGADGDGYVSLAAIDFEVDGAPGGSDMPGRLVFSTTPDGSTARTERLRIDNTGLAGFVNSIGFGAGGSAVMAMSATAPTISSGFGTSPSVANDNGTTAFTINVGTGGTANSGVIGLPTASNGWVCHVENVTSQAANDAEWTRQTASSATAVTVENQDSTGAATAWSASDVLSVSCFAY